MITFVAGESSTPQPRSSLRPDIKRLMGAVSLDIDRICSIFVLMSATTIPRDAHPLEMVEAMTRCAYELGLAAAGIAKRAAGDDTALFLAATTEFRHCSFAVRMGIRLAHAMRTATGAFAQATARVERPEREGPERERSDAIDPPERDDFREPLETEREGDYEPVSLPQFLKTLGLAAARADARRDVLPTHVRDTTLPALQGLLRRTKAPSEATPRSGGAAVAALARPPAVPAGRSRLLSSTGAVGLPPLRPTVTRRRDSG